MTTLDIRFEVFTVAKVQMLIFWPLRQN